MCSVSRLPNFAASYKEDYDYYVGNETGCSRVSHLCGSLVMIAVLIIGSMASAQAFPPCATGWTALGMGAGYMVIKLLGKDLHARRADLITTAIVAALLITFGTLGLVGVLSSLEVGYALLGVSIFTACLTVGMMMSIKRLCPRPA